MIRKEGGERRKRGGRRTEEKSWVGGRGGEILITEYKKCMK